MPTKKKKPTKIKKITMPRFSPNASTSKGTKENKFLTEPANPSKRRTIKTTPVLVDINRCDKSGVLRLFSPFNAKLTITGHRKTIYKGVNKPSGLSPRERSYVISSCQTRNTQYMKLKILAANAIKYNKIFSIHGRCAAIRKALQERGWVEKIPATKMNLIKIRNGTYSNKSDIHTELERLLLSNLVEKYMPNFIWHTNEEKHDNVIDMNRECIGLVNKLKVGGLWTSKQGLCSALKQNYWFYIEDVAEVNSPRSYNSHDAGDLESFAEDYKLTACTSLLKWTLSMVANERRVFTETGTISMNIILFALNRCREYLYRKQNKDIDQDIYTPSKGQWNAFLKKYYRVILIGEDLEADKDNKLSLYMGYAKFLLKEMHRYRPQLSCEGCHNIWIVKPGHCSRGRGIRIANKLGIINELMHKDKSKYVVQKYIEEPLLIHKTKFDIRQYYLVTSTYPLVIWMYRDCYLKFSSQRYSLKNYHESIHLTNNAVQRKYMNCAERHPNLPRHNMWHLDTYKEYLNKIGKTKVWDNVIYSGMRKSIIGIMLSCQDSLPMSKNRFELYGCDFILDKEYKPWLIEINSCPDLNHTTEVTAKICPAVLEDIIKVVIDRARDFKSSTGKFECIYRQPMTVPKYGGATDLTVRGYPIPNDYFYRGSLEIKETYNGADIEDQRDIKAILDRLKMYYTNDNDIMIEPEEESDNDSYKSNNYDLTCSHNTKSELELNRTAEIVSAQIDDIIDRATVTTSTKSLNTSSYKCSNSSLRIKYFKSMTDIDSLIIKPGSKFSSATAVNKEFKFSKLDDEHRYFKQYEGLKKAVKENKQENSKKTESDSFTIKENVRKATTKIIYFINKKVKEYYDENGIN